MSASIVISVEDKLLSLKVTSKDVSTKLKSCRSEISKFQKEKSKLEEKIKNIINEDNETSERLRQALSSEETLSEEYSKIQVEIAILMNDQKWQKSMDKYVKEISELKNNDVSIVELNKKITSKDLEIQKLRKELDEKCQLISKTRDSHDLATNPNSGCYLLHLDNTLNLKDKFVIPKEKISKEFSIYKFGKAKSIPSRLKEHNGELGKMIGKNLSLIHHKTISTYSHTDAENRIKKMFRDQGYTFIGESLSKSHNELVVINDNQIEEVKTFYDLL